MSFPSAALCHESYMMKSMMDTDKGSHVLMIHTRQEGGHLRKCQTLEPVQYECLHLEEW